MKKNKRVNLFNKGFEEVRQTLKISTKKELQYELDHHGDKDWKNDDEKFNNTPLLHLDHPEHKMPWTRRDFLGQGLIGAGLSVVAPSIFTSTAQAADCTALGGGTNANLPVLVIDCGGGCSMAGDNVMIGQNAPDQFLADMSKFGVPNNRNPATNPNEAMRLFGAGSSMLFHARSAFATGIQAGVRNNAILNNVDGTVISCRSGDDSSNNQLNFSQALVRAGVTGELAGAIGTRSSASGGRSLSIMDSAQSRATRVRNQNEAQNLVDPGILRSSMRNNNQSEAVIRSIAKLTEMQSEAIKEAALKQAGKDAVSCGAMANIDILAGQDLSGLYATAPVLAAYPNGPNGGVENAVATGMALLLQGKAGVATVDIGGCDYHSANRPGQNAKDAEIGRAIGAAIAMANAANSPLFIYQYSDGSTSADTKKIGPNGMFETRSDGGQYASLQMYYYDPSARRQILIPQLGQYGKSGVVPKVKPWSGSPSVAAQVAAVNYLYLAGRAGDISKLGSLPFDPSSVKAFA